MWAIALAKINDLVVTTILTAIPKSISLEFDLAQIIGP
jgi:hypothetical protein